MVENKKRILGKNNQNKVDMVMGELLGREIRGES